MLSAPKERAVLEMLGLRAGRPVATEPLSKACGGKAGPPWRPRPSRPTSPTCDGAPPGLLTTSGGYLLQLAPGSVDASVSSSRRRSGPAPGGGDPAGRPHYCRRPWGCGGAGPAPS